VGVASITPTIQNSWIQPCLHGQTRHDNKYNFSVLILTTQSYYIIIIITQEMKSEMAIDEVQNVEPGIDGGPEQGNE
jgi:hypothetical protein